MAEPPPPHNQTKAANMTFKEKLTNSIPKIKTQTPNPNQNISNLFSDQIRMAANQINLGTYKGEPSLTLTTEEDDELAEPFKYTLVGKFSWGRPSMAVIKKEIFNAGFKGPCFVRLLDQKHIILRFELEEDFHRMWLKQSWSFQGSYAKIFKWSSTFSPDIEPSIAPIWINFPLLPLNLFNKKTLYKLASAVGKPLRTDSATAAALTVGRPSVVYLTTQLHEDTITSVRNVNNWSGSVWMTPILGAYIADTYLGRFWTFTISSLIYVMGMVLLTMAVSVKFLKPTCLNGICNKASSSQVAFFYASLYIIAIGAGGTKPNISTFGADQFDDFNPTEKQLKVSFFNWWMFSAFVGALFATLGLVYIQDNLGWGLGYGIPTVGLICSLIIFYLGTPFYRHKVKKTDSPTADFFRVLITAIANTNLELPSLPSELYELDQQHYTTTGRRQIHHTPIFRFLDKAAIRQSQDSSSRQPCTVTQVEESKLILGMAMIWLVTLIPSTIWAQINTLFVKQGTTLDRHLGKSFQIPAASLGGFVILSMLLSVPFYDRYFVPFLRKKTGNPRGITLLQRLGIGIAIQILAIAIAYAVEVKRMHVIRLHQIKGPKEIVPMTVLSLLPQYILLGIADIFNAIGLLEFFYDQSPDDMRSLGTTYFTSGIGLGNFLNSFLVTVVDKISGRHGGKSWIGKNLNDSRLDYYYCFLLVISTLNLGIYLWTSRKYVYKIESTEAKIGCLELGEKAKSTVQV